MLHKIMIRFFAGLLAVLFAFIFGGVFGLGALFPLKGVAVIAFIVGFCFPSIFDNN